MTFSIRILPALLIGTLGTVSVAAPAPPGERPKAVASFRGHRFAVQDLAFSPDGKSLASAGRDGTVKVWDIASGRMLLDIQSHTENIGLGRDVPGIVHAVAFSPDGKILASSGSDRKVHLWNATTGKETDRFTAIAPERLLFKPDRKTLAAGCLLRNLKTGKQRNWWHGNTEKRLGDIEVGRTLDAKGKLVVATATIRPEKPGFTLCHVETGEKPITFHGHTKEVRPVAFSPDHKTLASAGLDFTVRFWDIASRKNILTINDHPGQVFFLLFSPDGKILATGFSHQRPGTPFRRPRRGSVRLYETATGRLLATLEGTPGPIRPLAFSPDGRSLATGTFGPDITLWKLPARYAPGK